MLTRIFAALVWLALAAPAYAQFAGLPGDGPGTSAARFPICGVPWKGSASPQAFPSGENQAGFGFFYNSKLRCFTFEAPKVAVLTGALASNIAISSSGTFIPLDTAVGALGFRGGLAQYPPNGTWTLKTQVTFSTPTTNSDYEIVVTQGLALQTSGAQAGIAIGTTAPCFPASPGTCDNLIVGGGWCTSNGASNHYFTCSASVAKIQCPVARKQSCELRVYAKTTADTSGTALASAGDIPASHLTTLDGFRVGGIDSQQ